MNKLKHEILHEMGINYNNEPELMKKGSVLIGADQDDCETTEKWETMSDEEWGLFLDMERTQTSHIFKSCSELS